MIYYNHISVGRALGNSRCNCYKYVLSPLRSPKGNIMKWLYSPESPMPLRIKAFIRWMIVFYHTRIRDRRYKRYEYEEGETVPELNAIGYLIHNGVTIALVVNNGNLRYYW